MKINSIPTIQSCFILIISLLLLFSCGETFDEGKYKEELAVWTKTRMQKLKAEEGFLNLAGLYWFDQGEYILGSDSTSHLVFPTSFPAKFGSIFVAGNQVIFTPTVEGFTIESDPLEQTTMIYDEEEEIVSTIEYGSYRWFVIKRGSDLGIRLKDYDHPLLQEEISIHRYPVNSKWRFEAEFVAYDAPRTMTLQNITGQQVEYSVPGKLVFNIEGVSYSIDPIMEGEEYFLIFSDETSGIATYGSGRYMYADRLEEGRLVVDFNKSYNPPCAFTDYATCLIPPPENRIQLAIEAGEKDYHL